MKFMTRLFCLISLAFPLFTNGQAVEGNLLGTWSIPGLAGSNAYDNAYNEIWGFAMNGHEYAVIGTTYGTHFIDVTDPTQPEQVFAVEGRTAGPSIIHRDFHDYKGYLYSIADEGANTTLQIIDITQLPDTIEVVYDSNEYFSRSHNIFIDSSSARLYSCISNGASFGYKPMRIFDISNPLDPQPILEVSKIGEMSISQVHDAYVQNDTAYLHLGPSGFAIVDYSNIDTPNVINVLEATEYPQAGYNHSGWITEDGNYYYMADENYDADIKVLDLRNLPDISVVNTFNAEAEGLSITHNQIVKGDKLYVSYYVDGLQVYDISDPENPVREMFYDTSEELPAPGTYKGAWGVFPFLPSGNILVSDMQNGLFVIDGQIPTSTEEHEISKNDIKIFPNPSNGQFQIDLPKSLSGQIDVQIVGLDGRLFFENTFDDAFLSIDVSDLQAGIYIAKIQAGDFNISERILIYK